MTVRWLARRRHKLAPVTFESPWWGLTCSCGEGFAGSVRVQVLERSVIHLYKAGAIR